MVVLDGNLFFCQSLQPIPFTTYKKLKSLLPVGMEQHQKLKLTSAAYVSFKKDHKPRSSSRSEAGCRWSDVAASRRRRHRLRVRPTPCRASCRRAVETNAAPSSSSPWKPSSRPHGMSTPLPHDFVAGRCRPRTRVPRAPPPSRAGRA
jgi:hypothetical protein